MKYYIDVFEQFRCADLNCPTIEAHRQKVLEAAAQDGNHDSYPVTEVAAVTRNKAGRIAVILSSLRIYNHSSLKIKTHCPSPCKIEGKQ